MKPQLDPKALEDWPALDGRMQSILELRERHDGDYRHAFHVAHLSLRIHDQLHYRHRCGAQVRELLAAAGLLHDIGSTEDPPAPHIRAGKLIREAALGGFSDREQRIIAQTARYHQGCEPDFEDRHFCVLHRNDRKMVTRLAGVVRVAHALDRTGRQMVCEIALRPGMGKVVMTVVICGEADREIEAACRASELFSREYGALVIRTADRT